MISDPYSYPKTNVLINKLNITDKKVLLEAERNLTGLRLLDLYEKPIHGSFDYGHLKAIHQYIFQDLYTWAGEERKIDIAKSNYFCKAEYIQAEALKVFNSLAREDFSKLSLEGFACRLAYYFSEINALHPFREGNGRTQREFIRELALYYGYNLSFCGISPKEMLEASVDSFLCKYKKIEQIFLKCLKVSL